MILKRVVLENFRNCKRREFEFSSQTSLVIGPNASGKTTLLEAVFLLASGVSSRAGLDRELIREGAPFASVIGEIGGPVPAEKDPSGLDPLTRRAKESAGTKELEVQLVARSGSSTMTTKRFKVNGVGRRLGSFLPHFHAILFSPEDLSLVTGSPARRRRFLDFALGSIDPRYRRALSEYDKVRKRRNRLLEGINQGRRREEELGFWDAKLLEFGTFLQDARKNLFGEINPLLHNSFFITHYSVSGLTPERLREFRPREIAAEATLIGPHRDDFSFLSIDNQQSAVSNRSLAAFGSRSEQRRAVLALKKAEMEFVEGKIGERPVLLLDDIFSELDEENRGRVASELVGSGQVIITTADIHHIPAELQENARIIEL